jgi:hypothetical protein
MPYHPGGHIDRPDDAPPLRIRRLPGEQVYSAAEVRAHGPALLAALRTALPRSEDTEP